MTYLRSFFLNFLIVFFAARVMPGITIQFYENVPNIGADILFSIVVGFLNSIIVPVLVLLEVEITNLKIAIIGFVISYLSFIIISIVDFGVTSNILGIVLGGSLVWVFSYFTNYLELKHLKMKK
ncbi:MAG: hypothetical protein KR126chlam5_00009 [Candidatus Anoxychlamydiales bacterium]|nr:hypothetical protein [Candidatus Anoxychlamydiales bacterium]NGX51726.1 hypothetical protein [Candidatus Anoxychlamydiales bacterium]